MKKLVLIVTSLSLAASVACASPVQNDLEFTNVSSVGFSKASSIQSDIGFSFANGISAENMNFLDEAQMSEVEGKGWKKKWKKWIRIILQPKPKPCPTYGCI